MCPMSFLFSSPFFIHLPLSLTLPLFFAGFDKWSDTHSGPPFLPFSQSRDSLFFPSFLLSFTVLFVSASVSPRLTLLLVATLSRFISAFYSWIKKLNSVQPKTFRTRFFCCCFTACSFFLLSYSISTTLPFWSCYIFPCASTKCYSSISAQPVLMTIAFTLTKQNIRIEGRNREKEWERWQTNHRWLMKALPSEPISNIHKPRANQIKFGTGWFEFVHSSSCCRHVFFPLSLPVA